MYTSLQKSLSDVWRKLVESPQLRFSLVLFVVFPLLFTYTLQQFLTTASEQVDTSLKQQINTIHSSLQSIIELSNATTDWNNILDTEVNNINTLERILIAKDTSGGLVIVASNYDEEIGSLITNKDLYQSAIAHKNNSLIFATEVDNRRVWLAYRSVDMGDEHWYIHTELNLATLDNLITKREYTAYSVLFVIFIFLGWLIWWLFRQTDYQAALAISQAKISEQHDLSKMMVHELRAPLTAIRGYNSMVDEALSQSAEEKKYTEQINFSVERLINLVNDFLEVSRIQSGTLKINKTEFNLSEVITNVVNELKSQATQKNLALVLSVPTPNEVCYSDQSRLHQVVTNLLSNAIKYTDTGTVTVVLNAKPFEYEIRIQDTGRGISADDKDKLFKPFVRVGDADQSNIVGSGLGMWITKQLAEIIGGTVNIESITGVGTHAVIKIPKVKRSK